MNGIDEKLKEIITVSKDYGFEIIEMEVMPDHVHLLIDCNPRFGVMDCVNRLKFVSANELIKAFSELKTEFQVFSIWTRNSFILSVGSVYYS